MRQWRQHSFTSDYRNRLTKLVSLARGFTIISGQNWPQKKSSIYFYKGLGVTPDLGHISLIK